MKEAKKTKSRRNFLRRTLAGTASVPVLSDWLAGTTAPGQRPGERPGNAVATTHRNLFNGDTCVFFYNPELWQPEEYSLKVVRNPRTGQMNTKPTAEGGPFSAKAIHRYVQVLAQNGIDTFVINANASRAWYPSRKIPSILDGYKRGDRDFFRGHAICQGITEPEAVEAFLDDFTAFMNRYQDLLDAGVDWLAETAKACRQQKVSPWVSIRMNDLHGSNNFEGSFFNLPLLKQKEMRLSRSANALHNPSYREGLNYEKAEVRALMFEQIREVVEDYDFEGLELDWWRQPLCCEPNASAKTVATMNDWFRQIRAMTERRAKKTGRPYPFGMRIPGRLNTLKSIGLDLVTLCREGTLDFICPSGFWCTTWDMPHDELRKQLGDRVAIYGVLEDGVNALPTFDPVNNRSQAIRYSSASREVLHANAAGKLALGADGIEWFNFYCTDQSRLPGIRADYSSLRNIYDRAYLRGKPKHYSLGVGGRSLQQLPFDLPAQLPVQLAPFSSHLFKLAMMAEPADGQREVVIQVVVKADEVVTELPVSFNGCWPQLRHERTDKLLFPCGALTQHTQEHTGYNVRFPVDGIREGWNEIVVENGGKQPITLVGLELAVRTADNVKS